MLKRPAPAGRFSFIHTEKRAAVFPLPPEKKLKFVVPARDHRIHIKII
jgi:hypothetical protein